LDDHPRAFPDFKSFEAIFAGGEQFAGFLYRLFIRHTVKQLSLNIGYVAALHEIATHGDAAPVPIEGGSAASALSAIDALKKVYADDA
jgi:hypothetical protein